MGNPDCHLVVALVKNGWIMLEGNFQTLFEITNSHNIMTTDNEFQTARRPTDK